MTDLKTIQSMLAGKPNPQDTQQVEYVGTVEAYDKWAQVRGIEIELIRISFQFGIAQLCACSKPGQN